jgi:murein DD-endopeptidase MepM/ murein hydrolase activator NlpD
MSEFGHRARALFDRVFPERQIYHRSGGTVRYISLSPQKQAAMALGAAGVAGWCVYATASMMLQGPVTAGNSPETQRQIASYERMLTEAQAQNSAMQAQLDETTREYQQNMREYERRHDALAYLVEFASGSATPLARAALDADGARMVNQASIDEADPRQSRALVEPGARVRAIGFRAETDGLQSQQELTLAQIENALVEESEEIRGVLRLTGVNVTRLTEEGGEPAVDQDLVDYLRQGSVDTAFARRVEQVAARVAEARGLRSVVRSAPLGPPVGVDYRETSGYGPRIDPFTGRTAFHNGLDFAAFDRAPVIASASGRVSYVGWMGGYGNVVEVDHGNQFRTRYAHLAGFDVRVGDQVEQGTRVGSMGSTGRSTGTHLHYEVFHRGRTVDPVNFIRAGRHVHEQG